MPPIVYRFSDQSLHLGPLVRLHITPIGPLVPIFLMIITNYPLRIVNIARAGLAGLKNPCQCHLAGLGLGADLPWGLSSYVYFPRFCMPVGGILVAGTY